MDRGTPVNEADWFARDLPPDRLNQHIQRFFASHSKSAPKMFSWAKAVRRCMSVPQYGQSARRFPDVVVMGR
jgi:hypothetical protein